MIILMIKTDIRERVRDKSAFNIDVQLRSCLSMLKKGKALARSHLWARAYSM